MKKKFLIFTVVFVIVMMVLGIVACTDYTDPQKEDDDSNTISRTQLVTNGTFYNATSSKSDDYIKTTVSGWTATKGSLATSASGVTVGVIDLNNGTAFDLNKDKFIEGGEINNPGVDAKTPKDTDDEGNEIDELQDTNALVIASKTTAGSVYYKNSSSFTLEAGKYYLLQYSVATYIDMSGVTDNDKQYKGAWVHVTGGVEYVDACINTNGAWVTHYLYIETNKDSSTSLDIRLWLGNGPEQVNKVNNVYATKGVAFFDNIICSEVTVAKDAAAAGYTETALDSKDSLTNHNNFMNMAAAAAAGQSSIGYESAYYLVDTKMEQTIETTPTTTNAINYYYGFREGNYTSVNTKNFNTVKGKNDLASTDQPSTTNAFVGIVDLSKLYAADAKEDSKDTYSPVLGTSATGFIAPSYDDWKNKIMTERVSALDETKALMISHADLSGMAFTTKTTVTIESNKYYKISVWAYVWAPVKDGKFDYPTSTLTEPKAYTDAQKLLNDYKNGKYTFPVMTFDAYLADFTEEENKKANVTGFATENIDGWATSSSVKDDVAAWLKEKAAYEGTTYDAAFKDLANNFPWLYVYDNFDSLVSAGKIAEGDRAYVEFRYLEERKKFVTGAWKTLKALNQSWDDYNDSVISHMLKYNVWESNNEVPYAKVKLTGAGDDIERKTENCNEGWEEIVFYVHGNQLSDRKLNIEFWFGEGSVTEYENLMFGGVFFDNIEIMEVVDEATIGSTNWDALAPITHTDNLSFGGLINEEDTDSYWDFELADKDKMANSDINVISFRSDEVTDAVGSIKVNDSDVKLRQLVYSHDEATASVLTSSHGENHAGDIKILPNKAYRFAIMMKTSDIESGKGVTINLMGAVDGEEPASVASVTNFNSDEWKEVVFYVLGDVLKTNYLSLKITMGSGSRFDTSNYVKGAVYLAVPNCIEIKYSEYNSSSKSGDEVKTYNFSNTATASESVTNGSFSSLDYSSTDDEEFDENGALTGVGTTSGWTKSTEATNTYNAVELSKSAYDDGNEDKTQYVLKWKTVEGVDKDKKSTKPDAYEVYVRYTDNAGKNIEKLYAVINKDGTYTVGNNTKIDTSSDNFYNSTSDEYSFTVDMTGIRSTSFKVRGIGENALGAYSKYVSVGTAASEGDNTILNADTYVEPSVGKKELKIGTVVNDGSLFETPDYTQGKVSYTSPYKTLLKIESNYGVGVGMTSTSKTLNANTYYLISVWVKTVGEDTKASVTVDNVSNVLTADVNANYIGYVDINTAGEWVQYCFYIMTGTSSSSFQLELGLGNPYAVKSSQKIGDSSSSVAVYNEADLSQGTVYFDSVKVLEVKEDEYNSQLEKGEYEENGDVKLHEFEYLFTNKYAIRNLVYTVDSFDSFDDNTTTEGSDGYNNGHTPKNYSWAKAGDATGTSEKQRLYGVYNYNMDVNKLRQLYLIEDSDKTSDTATNVFKDFMGQYTDVDTFKIEDFIKINGYNSLVMSNKVPYGQAYTTSSSSTINASSYYKLSFKAKTMIAKEVKNGDETTYKTDGVYAEFRYMQTGASDKYQSILINSYEEKEYTIYIYNPSKSSASAKWAFHLGADADEKDETGTKQLIIGMMVIDQVALAPIDEDEYKAQLSVYNGLGDDEKKLSDTVVYSYDEDKKDNEKDEDKDPEEEPEKQSVWDRGDVWLLVSSLVIAVIIIVVVVVVLVRRWKKKHPKEVVGENVAKTVKEIKVVEPAPNEKEDIEEDDEYSDVVKPVYVQRVVRKDKKKKKK